MATWPPNTTGSTIGLKIEGVTTILWGTDGLLQSPSPGSSNFYVVNRFTQSPKQEVSYLENGSGIQTTRVRLTHGHQWDISVRDDTRMTPPQAGATVTVVDAGGLIGARGLTYTASVIDPSYDVAPKQPGERVLRVESLLLVDKIAAGAIWGGAAS